MKLYNGVFCVLFVARLGSLRQINLAIFDGTLIELVTGPNESHENVLRARSFLISSIVSSLAPEPAKPRKLPGPISMMPQLTRWSTCNLPKPSKKSLLIAGNGTLVNSMCVTLALSRDSVNRLRGNSTLSLPLRSMLMRFSKMILSTFPPLDAALTGRMWPALRNVMPLNLNVSVVAGRSSISLSEVVGHSPPEYAVMGPWSGSGICLAFSTDEIIRHHAVKYWRLCTGTQQRMRDYSRRSNAFGDTAQGKWKNPERKVTDVKLIYITMFENRKIGTMTFESWTQNNIS